MSILQRGDDDYFVFFQQLHQYIYAVLRMCTPYHNKLYVSRVDHCSYHIPERPFVGSPTLASYSPPAHAGVEILVDHYERMQRESILSEVNGPDCLEKNNASANTHIDLENHGTPKI